MQVKVLNEKQTIKDNNSGFTLLEILVAVIILAVISIPLIRSFGTAAITNSKARILQLSTDCAENMMEIIESSTMDELEAKYNKTENGWSYADEKYSFTIEAGAADLPSKLPSGYKLQVTLDPTKFPNNNGLNISDVKSMSVKDTAVYEMSPLYDIGVYNKFLEWNRLTVDTSDSGTYGLATSKFFEENLTRYLDVTIEKEGTDSTTGVELVSVKVDIRYSFRFNNWWNYLQEGQNEYVEETIEIFNNKESKEPLRGIYLFFMPRYQATARSNPDIITIYNKDNIETNLFLAAQTGDVEPYLENMYFNAITGPKVTIEEAWSDPNPSDAAISLFTNLSEKAPYNDKVSDTIADIRCQLTYQCEDYPERKKTGEDAVKLLDIRNLDGKVLDVSNTKTRIYKVTTSVKDSNDKLIVELDGTKLE